MSQLLPLKSLISRSRSELTDPETQILLEAFDEASFLLDNSLRRAIAANTRAAELTAFTRMDIINLSLDTLFPTQDGALPLSKRLRKLPGRSQTLELSLARRTAEPIAVQATIIQLATQRFIITCRPIHLLQDQTATFARRARMWNALQALARALDQDDLNTALTGALQAVSMLTDATCLGIYQAYGNQPFFQRIAAYGNSEHLPDQLSAHDLVALQKTSIWVRGKKSITSLHSHARRSNLAYVASAPLGEGNAYSGLLAAGGVQIEADENLPDILNTASAILTKIIQTHSIKVNQRDFIQTQEKISAIQNMVINAVQDGVIILGTDLTIAQMNPAAEAWLGYRTSEVHGQPGEDILVGAGHISSILLEAKSGNCTEKPVTVTLYRRNGQSFLVNLVAIPASFAGQNQGVIVLFQDLSEQEKYKAQNQQLEQRALLGEFTASLSHELRNPINNISTGLQLLALNLPPEDPNQSHIQRLQQDCDRLAELIKTSLSFVKPLEYQMKSVDLKMMFESLLQRWDARLQRANIKYHLQIDKNIPPVAGDTRALEQVFTNLISNAMQAMQSSVPQSEEANSSGILALRARMIAEDGAHEQVEISVSDTGPGIPPEIRDRIFEPFYTTKENGTGLGLAIVKRIITAHKGSIQVTSIPGATIFHVRLPATASKGEI